MMEPLRIREAEAGIGSEKPQREGYMRCYPVSNSSTSEANTGSCSNGVRIPFWDGPSLPVACDGFERINHNRSTIVRSEAATAGDDYYFVRKSSPRVDDTKRRTSEKKTRRRHDQARPVAVSAEADVSYRSRVATAFEESREAFHDDDEQPRPRTVHLGRGAAAGRGVRLERSSNFRNLSRSVRLGGELCDGSDYNEDSALRRHRRAAEAFAFQEPQRQPDNITGIEWTTEPCWERDGRARDRRGSSCTRERKKPPPCQPYNVAAATVAASSEGKEYSEISNGNNRQNNLNTADSRESKPPAIHGRTHLTERKQPPKPQPPDLSMRGSFGNSESGRNLLLTYDNDNDEGFVESLLLPPALVYQQSFQSITYEDPWRPSSWMISNASGDASASAASAASAAAPAAKVGPTEAAVHLPWAQGRSPSSWSPPSSTRSAAAQPSGKRSRAPSLPQKALDVTFDEPRRAGRNCQDAYPLLPPPADHLILPPPSRELDFEPCLPRKKPPPTREKTPPPARAVPAAAESLDEDDFVSTLASQPELKPLLEEQARILDAIQEERRSFAVATALAAEEEGAAETTLGNDRDDDDDVCRDTEKESRWNSLVVSGRPVLERYEDEHWQQLETDRSMAEALQRQEKELVAETAASGSGTQSHWSSGSDMAGSGGFLGTASSLTPLPHPLMIGSSGGNYCSPGDSDYIQDRMEDRKPPAKCLGNGHCLWHGLEEEEKREIGDSDGYCSYDLQSGNVRSRSDGSAGGGLRLRRQSKEFITNLNAYFQNRSILEETANRIDPFRLLLRLQLPNHTHGGGGIQVVDPKTGVAVPNQYKPNYRQQAVTGEVVRSLSELIEAAVAARDLFQQCLDEAAAVAATDVAAFDESTESSSPVVTVAKTKSAKRAAEKAADDYSKRQPGPEVAWLFDMTRGSILCSSVDQMAKIVRWFGEHEHVVVSKNRFQNPAISGYRDLLFVIRLRIPSSASPRGHYDHLCEVQIHHKEIRTVDASLGVHKHYEYFRSYFSGGENQAVARRLVYLLNISNSGQLNESLIQEVEASDDHQRLLMLAHIFRQFMSEYDIAIRLLKRAIDVCLEKKRAAGGYLTEEDSENMSTAYNEMGFCYYSKGDFDNALQSHKEALRIREFMYGNLHGSTATSYNNVASVLYNQGQYESALEYYEKAREILESLFGPSHPSLAVCCSNIGSVLYSHKDYVSALECHEKALRIQEALLGKVHPDTATSYNNLGLVHCELGNYKEALEFLDKALKTRESVLGKNDLSTAASYSAVGMVWRRMCCSRKALLYYEKSLEIYKALLGKHVTTGSTSNTIAVLHHNLEEYDAAMQSFGMALEIFQTVHGPYHPDTVTCSNNLAAMSLKTGKVYP